MFGLIFISEKRKGGLIYYRKKYTVKLNFKLQKTSLKQNAKKAFRPRFELGSCDSQPSALPIELQMDADLGEIYVISPRKLFWAYLPDGNSIPYMYS